MAGMFAADMLAGVFIVLTAMLRLHRCGAGIGAVSYASCCFGCHVFLGLLTEDRGSGQGLMGPAGSSTQLLGRTESVAMAQARAVWFWVDLSACLPCTARAVDANPLTQRRASSDMRSRSSNQNRPARNADTLARSVSVVSGAL
eukprot:1822761-Rhodomonas_salina.1